MRLITTMFAAIALAVFASPASALLIDNFTDASSVSSPVGPVSTATADIIPLGSIVGGVRDSTALNLSGTGSVDVFTAPGTLLGPTMVMAYAAGPGVFGGFSLGYDGAGSGLGGVDFTDGGLSNSFVVGVNFSDFGGGVAITVDDGGGPVTSPGFPLPGLITGGAPVPVAIPFAAFPGIDFTTVESVLFEFAAPVPATDIEILFLETDFVIPEPATASLLVLAMGSVACVRRRR